MITFEAVQKLTANNSPQTFHGKKLIAKKSLESVRRKNFSANNSPH
jgi:hypothetical protein